MNKSDVSYSIFTVFITGLLKTASNILYHVTLEQFFFLPNLYITNYQPNAKIFTCKQLQIKTNFSNPSHFTLA